MVAVTNINVSKGPLVFLPPEVDFQKSNLFFVEIAFPQALFVRNSLVYKMINEASNSYDYKKYISDPEFLNKHDYMMRKTILVACKEIDIPNLDIDTEATYPGGRGDAYHLPSVAKYNSHQVNMKVIADSKGYIYTFFEAWMNLVYDKYFNTIGYYDDFVTDMTIYNPESFNLKEHYNSGGMKWLVEDFYPLYIKTGGFSSGTENEGGELDITCAARRAFLDKTAIHRNSLYPDNDKPIAKNKSNHNPVAAENTNKEDSIKKMTKSFSESIQEKSKTQILDSGKYASYLKDKITNPLVDAKKEFFKWELNNPDVDIEVDAGIIENISNIFNGVGESILPRVVLETIDTGLRETKLKELKISHKSDMIIFLTANILL